MTTEIFALASDHAGLDLKNTIKELPLSWLDLGVHSSETVDYPDLAHDLAQAIAQGKASRGILICGSGIGMSIAVNRHPHIRAALCTHGLMARLARLHNDANVLVLGARLIGIQTAFDCIERFLETPFEGGRHQTRIDKLNPE